MFKSKQTRSIRFRNLAILAAVLAGAMMPGAVNAQPAAPPESSETISIDAHAPSHPFPHYWERMFGSGRAILSLRESYRRDLRSVKRATGFEYIRFHGIFDDDVGVYSQGPQGQPVYNFTYVDQIYDGLLANGVRPFVELSFMPSAMASKPSQMSFWYRPYVAPPKDQKLWADLIQTFARHLIARYGIEEVSQWYFEVWNEPNIDFWAGEPKQETYFELYDTAAKALKEVSPRLRVGGPSTAQAAWVGDFIRHCAAGNIPVDFVSTHVYANDSSENVFGTHEKISRLDMVPRAVLKVHDEVKASSHPDLPIIFSEYNASYSNEVPVTDSAFMGPWLASMISRCEGLVDILAYWSFSDVFEEQGVVKRPFYGGYGLMAAGNIPKAAFNDFSLLHRLGSKRIELNSDSALATLRDDGSLAVAVWNYAPPGETAPAKEFNLSLKGLGDLRQATIYQVDPSHGSALAAWEAMGKPDTPSREQQEVLREAGRLPAPEIQTISPGDPASLSLAIPAHGLVLVILEKPSATRD
jgi:xylan 1,4-beta-xylosidase